MEWAYHDPRNLRKVVKKASLRVQRNGMWEGLRGRTLVCWRRGKGGAAYSEKGRSRPFRVQQPGLIQSCYQTRTAKSLGEKKGGDLVGESPEGWRWERYRIEDRMIGKRECPRREKSFSFGGGKFFNLESTEKCKEPVQLQGRSRPLVRLQPKESCTESLETYPKRKKDLVSDSGSVHERRVLDTSGEKRIHRTVNSGKGSLKASSSRFFIKPKELPVSRKNSKREFWLIKLLSKKNTRGKITSKQSEKESPKRGKRSNDRFLKKIPTMTKKYPEGVREVGREVKNEDREEEGLLGERKN